MKNKKGMSLIVLVITILVMIILAGVVIVSLSDNNPIKKASDAKEKSNRAEYANELELYHTNNLAITQGYNKKDIYVTDEKEIKKYINSISKEDAKNYVIVQGELYNKKNIKPGVPKLLEGMIPVKWNGTTEVETTASDKNWYDYDKQRLANAKTADGSYFVWIPRYEYKIVYNNPSNKSEGGEIALNMIPLYQTTPSSGYKIHPAFTDGTSNHFANGEWDSEITGIWVAKYEMSKNSGKPASKPNTSSWRNITIGDIYTNAYNYDRAKESHMLKNSEWGAVVYFTHSKYGKNGTEVEKNKSSAYITGNPNIAGRVNESSTGNITGIYDLNGCAWEFVAGYVKNGHANLQTNGLAFINSGVSTKYATVYPVGATDTKQTNYMALTKLLATRYGDTIIETSVMGQGSTSFFTDYSNYPDTARPFFMRGGDYGPSDFGGIFAFEAHSGNENSNYSWRVALCGN